jgi:hypothetical protein
MENGGTFPDPFLNQKSWEACLKAYLTAPDAFICPSDSEVASIIGSSYDWRDTGQASTTFAGQTVDSITRPSAVLAFDALAEWHARQRINAVMFDGSAQQMTVKECFGDLIVPVR